MLMGGVTANPETKPINTGSVTKFRLAVGRNRKNAQTGEWENDPNPLYIDCEAFGRPDSKRNLADIIAQYVQKGSQVYVEGRLQLDQWDDKTTGQKRSKHKLVVDNIEFLNKIPGAGAGEPAKGGKGPVSQDDSEYSGGGDSDSIPF